MFPVFPIGAPFNAFHNSSDPMALAAHHRHLAKSKPSATPARSSAVTENSLTRVLSPPAKATPVRSKLRAAILSEHDDSYATMQDEAGIRYAQRSGFNTSQIRDFQMLLELIKPIIIKPEQISGSREIAQGSFGTIYTAVYNKRRVAVKRINKDRSKSLADKMREAYLELNIMNGLSHPNVVQLIGVCAQFRQDKPQSFYFGIVLELCSDSLQKAMQKKRFSFAERMGMALEFVHGISYVHSMGVLHRDLSSQNILLTNEGHIKIADFGCARKVNERGEYKSTSITGSPAYMAPEQLEGRVLTLKADVWAVGINLWEFATQKLPWAEEAMRESPNGVADYEYCLRKVRSGGKLARPAPGQLNLSVADAYYQIIQSCLNKDPTQRPPTSNILITLQKVLSASSDVKLQNAIETSREMHMFMLAPDGIKSDTGEPAPEMEGNAERLKRRLFKFYRMYNPDKMYEVPQISKAYCDKQDLLNSSLKSRYTVDLTTFSMRTPSPFKSAMLKGPYVNRSTDLERVSKFSLNESETVQKDNLVATVARTTKSIHAMQTGRGHSTVETFGGRETPKRIPEESVKTWDSSTTIHAQLSLTPSNVYQERGYVFPGHELQCDPKATLKESEGTVQPSVTFAQQDRVKTIVTLMGTIKLLESKNTALLNARKDVDAELEKERLKNSELSAMVADLQHQLRLKAKYEFNMAKSEYVARTQDENIRNNSQFVSTKDTSYMKISI